jgi:hypothetical protein
MKDKNKKTRFLIDRYHISTDDALHLYTAWIRDCDSFIFQDKYLSKMIPKEYEPESNNKADRTYLQLQLSL